MARQNPAEERLVPGYKLDGRYELLYPYAQGGMATVWIARVQGKHGFEKLVAVKTILPRLARDQGFRAMFLDEASIASRIRHPNVADIDDLGEEDGTLYMVLEWVSGDSWSKLYQAIQKAGHGFPVDVLLRIGADACAGLHAAHELRDEAGGLLNVVHRDVSPQNVLVTTGGVTKVIDFGIAKAIDRMAEETKTGLLRGKASYAAPEQVRGKVVDRRADIWAMGTILYHYLAGRLPYEAKNDIATLKLLVSGRPPPPLPPEVPRPIAEVVMTALAFHPEARFPTALDMQRALESVLGKPTTTNDVAQIVGTYLADRIDMRRTDLAEAIAEAEQRAEAAGGAAPKKRGRLASFPELVPPPIVDQVLGRSSLASIPDGARAPLASLPNNGAARAVSASEVPPRAAVAPDPDDAMPTKLQRKPRPFRAIEWVLLAMATVLPVGVWALVLYVALYGPIGRPKPLPQPSPSVEGR